MKFAIPLTLKAWSCIHFISDRFGWVWLSPALIFCWGYFVKFECLSFSQSAGRCGLCLNKGFSSCVCSSFSAVLRFPSIRWRAQLGTRILLASETQQSLHSVILQENSGRRGWLSLHALCTDTEMNSLSPFPLAGTSFATGHLSTASFQRKEGEHGYPSPWGREQCQLLQSSVQRRVQATKAVHPHPTWVPGTGSVRGLFSPSLSHLRTFVLRSELLQWEHSEIHL